MSNLVYITGAPRCGKTTLTNHIANENTSILSLDSLSKSVRGAFTDFQLYDGDVLIQPNVNNDIFLKLVMIYCSTFFNDYPNKTLIVEGCHFTPKEFETVFPKAKIICVGLVSIDEIISSINSSEWMSDLPEKTKIEYAEKIRHYSKAMKKYTAKNYRYFERNEIDYGVICRLN
ncbi:MAG: hypothetical protein ACI4V4_04520 [Eubacterium sp.]